MDLAVSRSADRWRSLDRALDSGRTHVYSDKAVPGRTVALRVAANTPQSAIQKLLQALHRPENLIDLSQITADFTILSVVYTHDAIEIELGASSGPSLPAGRADTLSSRAPEHSIRASELRDMTGISAGTLAAGLGVSREQYQRWISGKPISTTRNGQLVFWHGLADEVQRKLGLSAAHVWWKTPLDAAKTPEQMFLHGDGRELYDLIVKIAEPEDTPDSEIHALVGREWGDDEPVHGSPDRRQRRGLEG